MTLNTGKAYMVDAITTQVVRNRVSSLMQEMHYHFYRSGLFDHHPSSRAIFPA